MLQPSDPLSSAMILGSTGGAQQRQEEEGSVCPRRRRGGGRLKADSLGVEEKKYAKSNITC